MDWKIKRRALKRWKALVPALLNGTKKFDLPRMFRILDDFLFMRALQDAGSVEWEDVRPEGIKYRGITVYNPNVRGPIFWIRVTKSSPLDNWSVQDFIVTLLHEMCHALLSFSCRCVACTCNLNKINSHGLLGHGPSWQSVLRAVEETANLHLLSGLGNPYLLPPFRLCAESVFSFETEETAKTKMLGDLYEKVKAEADAIAQLKKFERETKRAGRVDNTPENFLVELEEEQALASIAGMFTEM